MLRRVLLYFRGKWSSSDPVDRLVGAVGKVVVELGSALVVSVGFLGPLLLLDVLVAELRLFALPPYNLVAVGGPVAFFGNLFWCEIVLDLRQVEGERGEPGQPGPEGVEDGEVESGQPGPEGVEDGEVESGQPGPQEVEGGEVESGQPDPRETEEGGAASER